MLPVDEIVVALFDLGSHSFSRARVGIGQEAIEQLPNCLRGEVEILHNNSLAGMSAVFALMEEGRSAFAALGPRVHAVERLALDPAARAKRVKA